MLQWMGGSRRKVTTSRKSTQKRQKQYFEQRKRQQQQHQTTGVESFSDGLNTCSQPQNNNRSLDILCLLNLSTIVQDCKSRCCSAREHSEGGATVNYQMTMRPPTIRIDKVTPGDPIEFKEARNPSGCKVETVYPKKVLSSAPDCQNRDLIGNGDKTDQLKMATEHQLSVFDLIGDDGPNDNLEGSLVHEGHVAFVVEGLGKVETKTPVHSPQQPGRIFSYGSSSPLEAARQPQSSKNLNNLVCDLELESGAVIQDVNLPLSGSFLELPFCSTGIENSFSKPRQKLCTAKEGPQFNSKANNLKNSFADDEIFCKVEDKNDYIWNDTSTFLDCNFLNEDCDITWKKRPLKMDCSSADYWNLGNYEMSEFAFEGPHVQKIRVTEKATGRFDISDSPSTYSMQRRSENDHDFITPEGTCYPTVGRNYNNRDVTNWPAWSCYVAEDAGESLSLLSEESCSSSAVRGKATKRSPSNSVARQNTRRCSRYIGSPVNSCSVENIYAKDRHYPKCDNFHEGKEINGSGKFTKMCNPSSPSPAHFSNSVFQKKLVAGDSPFKEGFSTDVDSGFSSFCQTSGATKRVFSGPKLWTEDPFGAYPLPELHASVKSSFERSKHDVLPESLPSGSPTSEKLAFCQPYSHVHSYEPIFSTIEVESEPSKPNLSMDSNIEGRPRDSFPAAGSQEDAEFLSLSVEESVAKGGENMSEIHLTDCTKFELQKDICIGSGDLPTENGQPLEGLGSKDNCSQCKEAKDLTQEMENQKATSSPELAEEVSSSVKILDKFEGSIGGKEYHNDARTSLQRQNRSTEIEDFGSKETKLEGKGRNTSLDPSYQVMMLESYVLQLLCVQKVLQEASVQDTVKKV